MPATLQKPEDVADAGGKDTIVRSVEGEFQRHVNATLGALQKQKKFTVRIPQPPGTTHAKTVYHSVGINGLIINIEYGKVTTVPEEVYLILVRAGLVEPQREEDEREMPRTDEVDLPRRFLSANDLYR